MFAIAARRMGYRVHTLSPDDDTPTGQVADVEIKASYDDLDAVRQFARNVSVVTFEFENIPSATTAAAEKFVPVRPSGQVLHTTQNRLREKTFLQKNGFPVAPFMAVHSVETLPAALVKIGMPAVLKTAGWGYDGKGQRTIKNADEAPAAWQSLNTDEAILEPFVDFEHEVSVVAARSIRGTFEHYGVIANKHVNHILDLSFAPAKMPDKLYRQAIEIARAVMTKLDVVGVLCVEFFLTKEEKLLINELAPRPHNSGHLTFDACVTSQFEQQLRAICGLGLGSPKLLRPAAMANLLGDLWAKGEPNWARACANPDIKLHLYGKAQPRPGRKMGHLTSLGRDQAAAVEKVTEARQGLLVRV
jgi:5-(carboxyamino)imidazole ribonucleotide synthase